MEVDVLLLCVPTGRRMQEPLMRDEMQHLLQNSRKVTFRTDEASDQNIELALDDSLTKRYEPKVELAGTHQQLFQALTQLVN